jgi:hypothetical protein
MKDEIITSLAQLAEGDRIFDEEEDTDLKDGLYWEDDK